MTARRASVAGALAVLAVGGTLAATQPWAGSGMPDRLLAGDRPLPLPSATGSVPVAVPSTVPSHPASIEVPWQRVEVPRVRAQPACPKGSVLPAPSTTAVVPEAGGEHYALVATKGKAWLAFFGKAVADRSRSWLQGVDLADGRPEPRIAEDDLVVQATAAGRAWGTVGGRGSGVVELDLADARVARRWSADDLFGAGSDRTADFVAVSQGTAFVLSLGAEGSRLVGLDVASGRVRWDVLVDPLAPSGFGGGRNGLLTVNAGEAVVTVPGPTSTPVHVIRVGSDGRVLARANVVGPAYPMDPSVVVGPDGVYLSLRDELPGSSDGLAHLVRLDRSTLQLRRHVVVAGLASLDRGGTGLWTSTIACNHELIARYDPTTLEVRRTYDVHPDNHEVQRFDFTTDRLVVTYKKRFEDTDVVVESYERF
jgi:hypothetical protein